MSDNFPCPACGSGTSVKDSRPRVEKKGIRRRRQCENPACGERFTTFEMTVDQRLETLQKERILAAARTLISVVRGYIPVIDEYDADPE